MSNHTNDEIASAWLRNCRDAIAHGSESNIANDTFWAYQELDELCSSDPLRALDVVLEILDRNPEERVFYNLAAGPLEDLLKRNGSQVVETIRQRAAHNPRFRELLGGVWTEGMPTEVRAVVGKLADGGSESIH